MADKRKFRVGDLARVKDDIRLGVDWLLPSKSLVKVVATSDGVYDYHVRFRGYRLGLFAEELELHRTGAPPIKPGCPFGIPGARSL